MNHNFRLPAEWEKHHATWLSWPHNKETWPEQKLAKAEKVFTDIVKFLQKHERVNILVNNEISRLHVERLLAKERFNLGQVKFYIIPTNDCWCRDHGPLFVMNTHNQKTILNFDYNAWGGKYPPYHNDEVVPEKIAAHVDMNVLNPGIIAEPGTIEVNGKGTLIVNEDCILNSNRNPGVSKAYCENLFHDYLGTHDILWINGSIAGDDTDGHTDNLIRFIDENTIVVATEENPDDDNFKSLEALRQQVESWNTKRQQPFQIHYIPMPQAVYENDYRLPASYVNFYIANEIVLVPIYEVENDKRVLHMLQDMMPNRIVVPLNARDLIWGQGSVHCITMQEPA